MPIQPLRPRTRSSLLAALSGVITLAGGCPPLIVDDALAPRLADVNNVRDDTTLSAQQKREALAALGLDPITINATLQSERTANQFGGDLRTAFNKVTGGRLSDLTPDEIQIYADGAKTVDTTLTFTVSDSEADTVQRFLRLNGLNTGEQLGAFLDDPGSDVPSEIPAGLLKSVFVDFDADSLSSQLP